MTPHTNRTSVVAASAAAILTATLLAGCSSAGSVEDFCADMKATEDIMSAPGVEDPESEEYEAATEKLNEALLAIDPPSEIEDDWNVVMDATKEYADQAADLDPADPEDAEEISRLAGELVTDEYEASAEKVADFGAESCDA